MDRILVTTNPIITVKWSKAGTAATLIAVLGHAFEQFWKSLFITLHIQFFGGWITEVVFFNDITHIASITG